MTCSLISFVQNYGENQIYTSDVGTYAIHPPDYANKPNWCGFASVASAISALEQYYSGIIEWGGVPVTPTPTPTPVPEFSVTIVSNPSGASVSVDGSYVGVGYVNVMSIKGGRLIDSILKNISKKRSH